MSHFSESEVRALFRASVAAGLATRSKIDTLTASIHKGFISGVPEATDAKSQLFRLLNYMNGVERLRDGSVPMETFLANATVFADPVPEAHIIEEALDGLRRRSTATRSISQPLAEAQLKAWADSVAAAGGLERIVGRDDTLSFSFLAAGHEAGRSVVKLLVPRYQAGRRVTQQEGDDLLYAGTGWLITDSLIITNYHVINARHDAEPDADLGDLGAQAENSTALFDFDFDADTLSGTSTPVTALEAFSNEIDYAVLRIQRSSVRPPLSIARRLPDIARTPYIAMNIIQHPLGGPKRVALRNNLVLSVDEGEIRYLTDTERGSSGAPVCDDSWLVVALHRAWARVSGVTFQGKHIAFVNSGIPMGKILDDLERRFPALCGQIVEASRATDSGSRSGVG